MSRSKLDPLPIGTVVLCTRVMATSTKSFRNRKGNGVARDMYADAVSPFLGVISGGRYMTAGTIDESVQGFLVVPKGPKTFVYLVKRGYTSKYVPVPVDSVREIPGAAQQSYLGRFPMVYNSVMTDSEVRKALSEDAKRLPRDAKGKFTFGPKAPRPRSPVAE